MEFQTTQGGDTKLTFDPGEEQAIAKAAHRFGTTPIHVMDTLVRLRQADPLADFDGLMAKLPATFAVPAVRRKTAGLVEPPLRDPLVDLEADIRRRLSPPSSTGATSQMQQTDAILLQALATCLQTRALVACLNEIEMSVRSRSA